MNFLHLKLINQSYLDHFNDAMYYSFISLRSSFYFFVHAIWPDLFVTDGSREIYELNRNIFNKRSKLLKTI